MLRSLAAFAFVLGVFVAATSGCARDAVGAGEAAANPASAQPGPPAPTGVPATVAVANAPAPPTIVAEGSNPDVPLVVQVLDARRVTPDTVRVKLAIVNKPTSQEPL